MARRISVHKVSVPSSVTTNVMSFVAHRGRDLLIRGNTIDHSLERVWLGEQVPINTSQHTVEGEAIEKEVIMILGLMCI